MNEMDVLACPECGGQLQLIASIVELTVAKRTSTSSASLPDRLRRRPRNGEADAIDPPPAYDVADAVYEG